MGECLLARGAGGSGASKDPLDDIPITAGYCTILVTLKDSAGGLCPNTKINCKDGTRWYNYTTNEAGMALFKCNSGSANFYCNNWIDGKHYFDQGAVTINQDAIVGTKMAKEILLNKISFFNAWYTTTATGYFRTITEIKNVIVVGGGGSGGSGDMGNNGTDSYYASGGGGGGGAKNYAASIQVVKNQSYSIIVGAGGRASYLGNAGGTSSAFGLSANGGTQAVGWQAGKGGFGKYNGGNGGNGGWYISFTAQKNTKPVNGVNGAGGGGGYGAVVNVGTGIGSCAGANNGGGNGQPYDGYNIDGVAGSGGGGGGGRYESLASSWIIGNGGNGGSGRVTFNM